LEVPFITNGGMQRAILRNPTVRRALDGTVVGVIGVGQDITELRRATRERQWVTDDLERPIETGNAPIIGVGADSCVKESNHQAAVLTGCSKAGAFGKPFVQEFVTARCRPRVDTVLAQAIRGE